jgi:hypothetical protein
MDAVTVLGPQGRTLLFGPVRGVLYFSPVIGAMGRVIDRVLYGPMVCSGRVSRHSSEGQRSLAGYLRELYGEWLSVSARKSGAPRLLRLRA